MSIPPIVTLLGSGLPNINILESILADVDGRLADNANQLDSCLSDIMKQSNRLSGGKSFSTPRDALQYLADHHTLEKTTCYDPDLDDVMKFLSHVLHAMEESPGCEEIVLQELLSFSEHTGVSLPSRSSTRQNIEDSMVSLHTVTDTGELAVSQLWDKITLRLRKYFQDRLSKLSYNKDYPAIDISAKKRLEYVQALCSLFPAEDVWQKYRLVRAQQLGVCFATLLSEGGGDDVDIVEAGNNCEELTDMIITLMNQDYTLFITGVFRRAVTTLHALHDIYLDKFGDEMSALIDEIQDEMACSAKKGSKWMPQSQSELGLQGSPTHLVVRGKTKSLDSMSILSVEQLPHRGTPKPTLPLHLLRVLIKVVEAFLHIDRHMETLHGTMSWEVGGVNSKKSRSRGSIRGVLKASPSPDMMRRPMSAMSHESAFSDTSTPSVDTSFSSSISASFKTPKVVEKTQAEDRPRWDWTHMFKKLSPELSQCVDHLIQQARQTSLAGHQGALTEGEELETVNVPPELVGGRLDYPRIILKSCSILTATLDSLLPLAIAGSDSVFHATRTTFVDAASLVLKDYHMFLVKLSADVPKTTPPRMLYVTLSSGVFIRNHIIYYENMLSGDTSVKKYFPSLSKQYAEFVETVTSSMSRVHIQLLSDHLLFDAESYHWDDSKEFYENERCAFPVQMWNLHLQGLRADLWSVCPPRLGQQVFTSVLQESLDILTRSYVRVHPSYRRTPQYRADIITILLCVSELLPFSCNAVSKYLDVNKSQTTHYLIHNQCCHLLSALAIVTSPLEVLYKIFKKGFTGKKTSWCDMDSLTDSDTKGYPTHWLSWIRPHLVGLGQRHYEDIQTTCAVHLQVKLITCQPTYHWPMIVQAMVMKDFTLSILILTSAIDSLQARGDNFTPEMQNKGNNSKDNSNCDIKALFDSFFYVMLHCTHFPDGIGRVVLPVINRSNEWEQLSTTTFPKGTKTPVWLESVYDLMTPFINRVIKPVVVEVIETQEYVPDIPPIMSVLQELPCGCPLPKQPGTRSAGTTGDKELLEWALRELVSQLCSCIELLPYPVYVLFRMLQESANHKKIKLSHDSMGLQVIAGCLRHRLSNPGYVESVTGVSLRPATQDTLIAVADSVYNTLTSTSTKSSMGTPRPAGAFKKHNKEWLSTRIETMVNFLHSEMFEPSEGTMLDGSAQEFADQVFLSSATDILTTPHGQEHMEKIHSLLVNNREWLDRQLDIQPPFPQANSIPTPAFSPCTEPKTQAGFNPIHSFNRIGNWQINHSAIMDFPFDWHKLLQTDLGLSEVGFHTLLFSRHEMQEGAYVEGNEQKAVMALRRKFGKDDMEMR
ncbi:uncharacterized protein KIAA0825-like [Liolophura sinensis]|uniref:uncharacterized protein KIAA0825-like n=1 Tax=Liolophura sinensis TaxID=3198878 RepID=UPI003158A3A3